MTLRPLHDWVVVALDPIPEFVGSIVAFGSGAERRRTGTVLRIGPGRYLPGTVHRVPTGLEEGDRVTFFREHLEHQQGKEVVRICTELEPGTGIIRAADILYKESLK